MRIVALVTLCALILIVAYGDIVAQRKKTAVLDVSVRLLGFLKNELSFHKTDIDTLFCEAHRNGFDCFDYDGTSVAVSKDFPKASGEDLLCFLNAVGTTDCEGQVNLCDEYLARMKTHLYEQRLSEKSKTTVSFALGILGSMSIIVLFA